MDYLRIISRNVLRHVECNGNESQTSIKNLYNDFKIQIKKDEGFDGIKLTNTQ